MQRCASCFATRDSIDGTGSAAQDGAALLIEGDTIVHAGPLAVGDEPDAAATYLYSIIGNGPRFGIDEGIIAPSGLRDEIKQASDTYRRARELGIRMCPGGDFGFAWNPRGEYAKDIQVFVDVIGCTPLEAIACATRNGAELMRTPDRIGTLTTGRLADLVVVDGDPLRDITVLQDRARLSVMQGGRWVSRNLGGPDMAPQSPQVARSAPAKP